jgi:hypothetical protein
MGSVVSGGGADTVQNDILNRQTSMARMLTPLRVKAGVRQEKKAVESSSEALRYVHACQQQACFMKYRAFQLASFGMHT